MKTMWIRLQAWVVAAVFFIFFVLLFKFLPSTREVFYFINREWVVEFRGSFFFFVVSCVLYSY